MDLKPDLLLEAAFFIVVILMTIYWIAQMNSKTKRLVSTLAKVKKVESKKGRDLEIYHEMEVEYKNDLNQVTQAVTSCFNKDAKYQIGDKIEIMYDPKEPERVITHEPKELLYMPVICMVVFLGLLFNVVIQFFGYPPFIE